MGKMELLHHETGFGDVNMNSFNHYSFGAVMEWMYRYMVGIQSRGFAFEQVLFTPKPDMRTEDEIPAGQERITWAKGSYNSKNGLISSEWRFENGNYRYCVEAPVQAEFLLPLLSGKEIFTLNGIENNVADFEKLDNCAVLLLDSGKHEIVY